MEATAIRFTAPDVLVRRVVDADGAESATVRLRCPDCGRPVVMKDDAIREFLNVPLPGATSPEQARLHNGSRRRGAPIYSASPLSTATLAEVVVREVVCVRPDTSLEALRALLIERGISGAPVIDRDGRMVGVVSKTDLVRWDLDGRVSEERPQRAALEEGITADLGSSFHVQDVPEALVADVMTPHVLALPTTASVLQAAALMAYEGVHRIVVVDFDVLVGIVTSIDVMGWLARHFGWAVPPYPRSQRPAKGKVV